MHRCCAEYRTTSLPSCFGAWLQGAFGGGLIATAQATLKTRFQKTRCPEPGASSCLAPSLGPRSDRQLGGLAHRQLTPGTGSFSSTLFPARFAAIVILIAPQNPTQPTRLPVPTSSDSLLIAGLGSLQYVLGEGQRDGLVQRRKKFYVGRARRRVRWWPRVLGDSSAQDIRSSICVWLRVPQICGRRGS